MTAAELNEVYRGQLRASLLPPWKPGLDPGGDALDAAGLGHPAGR